MMKNKKQSGVTLIALIVTIIIITIIASISVYEGSKMIKEAKVETIETNMLTLQAKAKGFAEDVEAQIWAIEDEEEKQDSKNDAFCDYGMIKINNSTIRDEERAQLFNNSSVDADLVDVYYMSIEKLNDLGLNHLTDESISILNVKGETVSCASKYMIVIDRDNYKNMDIIYTEGITYENEFYYTLSALKEAFEA